MATVLYERNDLDGAALSSQLGLELAELGGHPQATIGAYFCLAQKLLAHGDEARAEEMMKQEDKATLHPSIGPVSKVAHIANRVMFAVLRDDLEMAIKWGNQFSEYPDNTLGIWSQPVPARLLIARGNKGAAAEKLLGLYKKAIQADAQGYAIRVRVYQALAADTQNEATAFLAEALKKGEPEGFIRTFVDEGKLLKPLLRKALDNGVTPEYTAKLLDIIEAEENLRKTRSEELIPPSHPPGVLSAREHEILKLVAAGFSNRQISERLIISLGTVKTHVHNIFEKLDAKSRTQAIGRAKELKLILS